jgi:hypothetical protein
MQCVTEAVALAAIEMRLAAAAALGERFHFPDERSTWMPHVGCCMAADWV